MKLPVRTIAAVLAGVGVCANVHARDPLSELPEQFPASLNTQVVQEARVGKAKKVSLGGGSITLGVVGKLLGEPEYAPDAGMWTLKSDIGTKVPMECWVFEKKRPLGNALRQIQGRALAAMEQDTERAVAVRHPYFLSGGAVAGGPYLASEWLYGLGEVDALEIRMLKARGAHKDGATIVCSHDEVGYHLAFERIFDKLMNDAAIKNDERLPEYREIYALHVGDRPIGVTWIDFNSNADGVVDVAYHNSYFYADADDNPVASDHLQLERSGADGALLSARERQVANGKLGYALVLEPDGDNSWKIEGEIAGEAASGVVKDSNVAISEYGQRLLLQRIVKEGNKKHRTFHYWQTSVEQKKFGAGGFRLVRKSSKSQIWFSVGSLRGVGRFDKQGSLVDGKLTSGDTTTDMKRVWVGGKMP